MAVWDTVPLAPLTVTAYEPEAEPVQDSVDVTVPPMGGVTLEGLRLHVNPVEGEIEVDSATAPLNPF